MPFGNPGGYGAFGGGQNPLMKMFGGGGFQQGGQQTAAPPPPAAPGYHSNAPGPGNFSGIIGSPYEGSSSGVAAGVGAAGLSGVYGYGVPASDLGFQNLLQILGSKGATDPALLNRQLADVSRTNQSQQDQFAGQLARMGLSGSGAGAATLGAIGAHGGDQRAQVIAQDTAMAEERKRQDLNLLLSLVLNPGLGALGARLGVPTSPGSPSNTSAIGAGLGAGIGGLAAGMATGGLGAPAGAAIGGSFGGALGGLFD